MYDDLREDLRAVLDGPAPPPTTALDTVLRRGRRRVRAQRTGAAAGVIVVLTGLGAGLLALHNVPQSLPPVNPVLPTTTDSPHADWPRADAATRTPSTTFSYPGMPPLGCAPTGTPPPSGPPGSDKAPSNVLAAWEQALTGIASAPTLEVKPPRSPHERETYNYRAEIRGHGGIRLRVGGFTGSPLARADAEKWEHGDCAPPKRRILQNGTVVQLYAVSQVEPVPSLYQSIMIYTTRGASYEITLSNHRIVGQPELGGNPGLPLSERQLADIALAVAEAT